MPYATIGDCTLHYETGSAGIPVVYIHGGFASLDTLLRDLTPNQWGWEYDFAASFCFVSYDRRGCYRSSSPDTGYDLWSQVRDLTDLLDHLHIETVHLIGNSAGGPIALLFAVTQPQRTRSLILVGTDLDLFPAGEPGSEIVRQHLTILERDGSEAAFDLRPAEVEVTFSELWDHTEASARGTLDEYRARQQQWRAEAQALPRAQRVHYYATELQNMQAYMVLDLYLYAKMVQTPTLVIHGSNDQLVPLADAEELAQAIPTAQLAIVDGGSHSLMIRNADARRQVLSFMHDVDAGGEMLD